MNNRFYILISLVSILLGVIVSTIGKSVFTPQIVNIGLLFLAILIMSTYAFASRTVNDPNPNKFVRTVMASTMIKFFVGILGVGAMLLILKKTLHKPDLFLLMGIYLVYTITEAVFLAKIARAPKQS